MLSASNVTAQREITTIDHRLPLRTYDLRVRAIVYTTIECRTCTKSYVRCSALTSMSRAAAAELAAAETAVGAAAAMIMTRCSGSEQETKRWELRQQGCKLLM